MEYKKVNQNISNIVNEQVRKLESIFPSAVKDGEVDFEALREELGQFQEVDNEKYELTWSGKKNAKKIAQEDVAGRTLKFIPEDSKDVDTTENLYIEGDNLEVLKLLRQNYYGAIKMIYIDPPYNTGKDFVYNDSFTMSQKESDVAEGKRDELGERYVINKNTQNRFHAKWLNMMYARLKVAKDLLKDDGVVFVSIDENEYSNLKKICDEIMGDKNFVADLVWQKKTGASDAKGIAVITEYILVYIKNSENILNAFTKNKESYDLNRYKYRDDFYKERGPYYIDNLDRGGLQYSDSLNYGIECPDGKYVYPNGRIEYLNDGWIWKWGKDKVKWAKEHGFIDFRKSENKASGWSVCYKNYLYVDNENNPIERAAPHKNLVIDVLNANAAKTMKELFGNSKIFSYSKPFELIEKMITYVNNQNEIILDFFSGSATTAQAVFSANAKDGGKRKFVLVQLEEEISEEGFSSICEIGKERIRRAGEKIKEEHPDTNIDIGFKVFRTADTNIKWNSFMKHGQLDLSQMEINPDTIDFMPGAKDEDIVYELMLRQRDVALSEQLEKLSGIGERTYLYASSYLVCLETKISTELINKLAEIDPLPVKFIFRDSAFQDDISLKDETFRRLRALIEKNAGINKLAYTVEFI